MAEISPVVRALISEHISSVAQLEMLLLLRMNPERWWAADALSQELRAEVGWLTRVLTELCDRGFCEKSADAVAQFRFRPRSEALEQAMAALAQDYLVHRVRVTELIYNRPPEALRAFSDAFDLRKGGRDV